jgi:RNA polymerase sigma-70 factor, ECF subfamily
MDDATRFESLVHGTAGDLRAYLAGMGLGVALIDDVAQEAYLALWKEADRSAISEPLAWLKAVAKRRAIDQVRGMSVRRRHLASLAAMEETREAANDHGMVEALQGCLQGLSAADRELIERRYRDEGTAEDLARAARSDVSTVRRRLASLRQALQRCIERRIGAMPV